jgi:cytochrome P450
LYQLTEAKWLDMIFKESMRMYNPVTHSASRKAVRNFKFGDLKVRKGDVISYGLIPMGYDTRYFKDPSVFTAERFSEDRDKTVHPKVPKNNYVPFSFGARKCIGQVLGEVMVKVVVVEFLKMYELEKLPDWERKMKRTMMKGIDNPVFKVKSRLSK